MFKPINIIDLFAGPGGLGEGFSRFMMKGAPAFRIRMSVEKEESAHKTLTLRALFRNLVTSRGQDYYRDYVAGSISKETLTSTLHHEWLDALHETMQRPVALGIDNEVIHKRLRALKKQHIGEPWIVIGGPPCQAYSLAGRSRNKGIKGYRPEDDHRHFLYKEYLSVLDVIQPEVFVMENVKGILTSTVAGEKMFPKIRADLEQPSVALYGRAARDGRRYKIYSLSNSPDELGLWGPNYKCDSSYIVKAENYGVPQARHRVILLGIAQDLEQEPGLLNVIPHVNIEQALFGLPPLRSRLSKGKDSSNDWSAAISDQAKRMASKTKAGSPHFDVARRMTEMAQSLRKDAATSAVRYKGLESAIKRVPAQLADWLLKDAPGVLLNHQSRSHMSGDLGRYLFATCWAESNRDEKKPTPRAKDFPKELWPNHANWNSGAFADRFRVQVKGRPATTITSHISKDGHYFIHFDPGQCRSLTVREAARIQTFPDSYFFEGNTTQQYVQVGNAVPPYLANQIAQIVAQLFHRDV